MKKRRTLIISLLLVAALALGIGYAGFTSELMINGDAVLKSTEVSQVNIKNIELVEHQGDITLATEGLGTKTAQADVTGFASSQDYALITVTIENPHEFAVNLSAPQINLQNNAVSETVNYFKFELVDSANIPTSISAASYNSEGVLEKPTVTFQYRITPITIPSDAHTVSYTITANASTR